MRSLWIWLPFLLLIYHMEQVQGNNKMHDSSLKPLKNGSDSGNPVLSLDLSRKIHSGICKCKVNGRWERHPCPCSKFLRRKNRRGKIRKLCKKMKHLKKCQQRNHVPIIPF